MKSYTVRIAGVWLDGEVLISHETKRKAFNAVKKELEKEGLWEKNKELTIDDLIEVDTGKPYVEITNNGDY